MTDLDSILELMVATFFLRNTGCTDSTQTRSVDNFLDMLLLRSSQLLDYPIEKFDLTCIVLVFIMMTHLIHYVTHFIVPL